MKVLLVFPVGDRQTGLFIYNAFIEAGCDVCVVDANVEPNKMVTETINFNPDLVFMSRTETLYEGALTLRKEFPKVKTVCYNVDARHTAKEFGNGLLRLFNSVDIFYSKPSGMIQDYQNLCPDTIVKCLPEGFDPSINKKETITEDDMKKYGCDVVFIGTKHEVYKTPKPYGRIGLIDYILKNKNFDFKLVSYDPPGVGVVIGEEHNKTCQCAKIVLGHCGWADVKLANSARDFRVTGSGGFLLTEDVDGIEELFDIGKEIETYKTPQECLEKINYYLENENKRKEIAENGYMRSQRDHTFRKRIDVVLNDVSRIVK